MKEVKSSNSLNTIEKLISGEIDIGFVNEDYLIRYINKNRNLIGNNNNSIVFQNINFSVLGGAYYKNMFFLTKPISRITTIQDVRSQITIGVTNESHVYISNIIKALDLNVSFLIIGFMKTMIVCVMLLKTTILHSFLC